MDDSRFDRLTKQLGQGASRRTVLKGLLGIGGAAVVAELAFGDAESARRPNPTPKPLTCPGNQQPVQGACACVDGLTKCGSDCCNETVPRGNSAHSECCDGACCFGACYGEELCCATGNFVCDGVACCAPDEICVAGQCIFAPPTQTPEPTATAIGGCSVPSDCGVCECLDQVRLLCPECRRGQCGGSVTDCGSNSSCIVDACVPNTPIPECTQDSDCGVPYCVEGEFFIREPRCDLEIGECWINPGRFCPNGCNAQTLGCYPSP